ncbi:MAG: tRNA lysidine(34) synthetase TilS [Geobacteraceae bacterium GWC2_58_44]|nr:MAG: tRNA lysidine(34) synthetase TilS [Geobacteraceae bacterium GWC2_58_44]HBG07328.1 tRNA lysidine(34) synthetase TilS [Geobacter sp.]
MKTLLAKVRSQRLFKTGETVVVAVSGGADSVALLDILARLGDLALRLVVAHLNHGLRGRASDGDEEFVSGRAAQYGLPFVLQRTDVKALAASSRLSLEDAGRRARYAFFARVAKEHGATSIALAHHLDDQAETVLIRLLRGAGASGLSAMGSGCRGILKRPLLQVSRSELEHYLKGRGLSYRTDATNADTAILRNSIRHELIPFLRKYNPKVSERLAATAEILACDEELLEQLTETAYARLARSGPSAIVLEIEALARERRGLRLRLYRRALLELRGDLRHIGLAHLEAIDRLTASERPNSRLKLPGECHVSRSYGRLSFAASEVAPDPGWELAVEGEGSYPLPGGGRLLVQRLPRPLELDPGSRRVAYLNPEKAPFPWLLRGFAPGDRFTPLGMSGAQKVKDLFINEKIPHNERGRVPLLVSCGRIICVLGVRMGDHARLTAATGAALRVEILDITP